MPDLAGTVRLVAVLGPVDPVAALAHLLTPVSCAVGVGVRVADGVVAFRGGRVDTAGLDLPSAATALDALVRSRLEPHDVFVDASSGAGACVVPVRSGAGWLLAGLVELYGASPVLVEAGVGDLRAVVRLVVEAIAEQRVPDLAGLGARVEVGHDGSWRVRPAAERPVVNPAVDVLLQAARSASTIGAWFGAAESAWTPEPAPFPGTVKVTGVLTLPDGHVLEVPLTQAGGSRLVGVPSAQVLPDACPSGLPAGFAPVGIRLRDGVSVVEHMASGVRAAVTRCPVPAGTGSMSQEEV